jgi:outer membrane protein assembly factor BamB
VTPTLEDRFWDALEPAVRRELERPRLPHGRPTVRGLRTAASVAVVLLALAAGIAMLAVLSRQAPQPARPVPANVETAAVGTALGDAAVGYGAVWTYDIAAAQLLRIDPSTRRVDERLTVRTPYLDVAVATGAGAVWAVPIHATGHMARTTPSDPLELVRFDPQNGREVARIPIRVPGGDPIIPFGLAAADDGVWVWGQGAAVRIDPRTDRIDGAVRLARDDIQGFTIAQGSIWLATDLARVLRFDARTTERLAVFRGRPLSHTIPLVVVPEAIVIDGQDGTLYARDPASGRPLWRVPIAGGVRSAAAADGRIWILTASSASTKQQLVALDLDTGRTVVRIGLPTDGGSSLHAVGSDLWVTDGSGDVHIVHP